MRCLPCQVPEDAGGGGSSSRGSPLRHARAGAHPEPWSGAPWSLRAAGTWSQPPKQASACHTSRRPTPLNSQRGCSTGVGTTAVGAPLGWGHLGWVQQRQEAVPGSLRRVHGNRRGVQGALALVSSGIEGEAGLCGTGADSPVTHGLVDHALPPAGVRSHGSTMPASSCTGTGAEGHFRHQLEGRLPDIAAHSLMLQMPLSWVV